MKRGRGVEGHYGIRSLRLCRAPRLVKESGVREGKIQGAPMLKAMRPIDHEENVIKWFNARQRESPLMPG